MAMRKLLSKKLSNITNVASQSLMNCRISSSSLAVRTRVPTDSTDTTKISPEPGDSTISRRFMHNSAMIRPEIMQMPLGESLIEKLREIDGSKDRIRLDGLAPPETETSLTVADTKKLLRAAQIEIVKSKLRETGRSWMTYSEFVSVCGEASSDPDLGSKIAKMLDDSANVIVLGDSVCIRPDQVTKSIEGLLPLPKIHNPNDPRRIELKELEAEKAVIDVKAHSLVRKELWAGLGYLILQTAGFMRLTFWELSWDVMEPICFYVTSVYFMAGYAFFLRTSKEPSFEGFYQSRFEAKQRKLMNDYEFDHERYDELKKLFCSKPSAHVSKILGAIKN
ncbi:Calcium uniporter protein C-terminal [Arabidopsis thaliana x Arabidopsis arenosa]|uniref:Calcium uniporter protein C-terminal n=1 Tax=Arabidopsis thaliana x Arabidopsis arenosa TaxID=1240361 RepID=A0A8T2A615_9BRAS|nr:Calcium uniporter protein C-terminal [Arabidopsis thaliana x Arabidopsis arenosa]